MPLQFAATLFLSATLLFMVQPMVGKMVLPLLGGSPAVWNACMVFFQALLLLGYLYAHWLSTRYEPKQQWKIHLGVLLLPVVAMAAAAVLSDKHSPVPIAQSLVPGGSVSPIFGVLAILTVAIGIPFFVASTSAPLLQKWFAFTGHPSARDPYFLYAASNAGSLISLLGYPFLIEPRLAVVNQAWVWALGFAVLIAMILVCGWAAANPMGAPPNVKPSGKPGVPPKVVPPVPTIEAPPSGWRIAKWTALAFVPSSLMLGVTFHMTTDIASIPLLWVAPLALYLITFIIAFGRVPTWFRLVIGNLGPVMILLLVFLMTSGVNPGNGPGISLALHLATFFAVALMCHYELAIDRPGTAYLTSFFLWMSVGGVLGGVFNAIVAPLVFPLAYEYRVTLVVACLMVPRLLVPEGKPSAQEPDADRKIRLALDLIIPLAMAFAFYGMTALPSRVWFVELCKSIAGGLTVVQPEMVNSLLVYAVPVMACFFFVDRPLRFALCVAAILGVNGFREDAAGLVHSERSFFGILKVEDYGLQRRLVHGTTLHGTQFTRNHFADQFQALPMFSPWDTLVVVAGQQLFDLRQEPLTYYHRTGPVGAAFRELRTRKNGADAKAPFAMVGLGTGSVSCYALPGQKLTFYEIDPAVKKLVADTDQYFTYVTDARNRGAELDFRMGDARLKLQEDTDRKYSLLLVDAFSSDSIPIHLLTKEAVELYMNRITDDGLLMIHISNKFVDLEPVVAAITQDLGLAARVWSDNAEKRPGKTASSWVAVAKDQKTLGTLGLTEEEQLPYGTAFKPLRPMDGMPPWTDDYSDVLRVMMIDEVQKVRRFFGLPTLGDR